MSVVGSERGEGKWIMTVLLTDWLLLTTAGHMSGNSVIISLSSYVDSPPILTPAQLWITSNPILIVLKIPLNQCYGPSSCIIRCLMSHIKWLFSVRSPNNKMVLHSARSGQRRVLLTCTFICFNSPIITYCRMFLLNNNLRQKNRTQYNL